MCLYMCAHLVSILSGLHCRDATRLDLVIARRTTKISDISDISVISDTFAVITKIHMMMSSPSRYTQPSHKLGDEQARAAHEPQPAVLLPGPARSVAACGSWLSWPAPWPRQSTAHTAKTTVSNRGRDTPQQPYHSLRAGDPAFTCARARMAFARSLSLSCTISVRSDAAACEIGGPLCSARLPLDRHCNSGVTRQF